MPNAKIETVAIPRELAHRVTSLLQALEEAWYGRDEEVHHEVSTFAKEFIIATKLGSRSTSDGDLQAAKRLIPGA